MDQSICPCHTEQCGGVCARICHPQNCFRVPPAKHKFFHKMQHLKRQGGWLVVDGQPVTNFILFLLWCFWNDPFIQNYHQLYITFAITPIILYKMVLKKWLYFGTFVFYNNKSSNVCLISWFCPPNGKTLYLCTLCHQQSTFSRPLPSVRKVIWCKARFPLQPYRTEA